MDGGLLSALSWTAIATVAAVYLLAGMVKGALGFGLPVISIALLPFVVPLEAALALNAIVILFSNIQQVRVAGRLREAASVAWPMIAGLALTVPVGAAMTASLPEGVLAGALGGLILIFVAFSLARPSFAIGPRRRVPVGFGLGLASGIVGALTTAPGPIFVAYVTALAAPRQVHMGALGLIMGSFGAVVTLSFVWAGVLRAEHVALGLVSVLPVVAGMSLGNAWAARLPLGAFRTAVLVLLAVLAVLMLRRAIAAGLG